MTIWLAGMAITADRLNDYEPDDEITSGLVAATNFTVQDFYGYRSKGAVVLDMQLQYTGGGITPTTGNITDTACCTVPVGWRPNGTSTINGSWDAATEGGGFVIGTDGICTLRTASDVINTSASLRLHIGFIISP